LFHSPYEAAVWAVLAVRRPQAVAAAVRDRLSEAHGTVLDVGGESVAVLPSPEQLLRVESFDGVPADRWERLHGIARAALDGELDNARLRALGPDEASVSVQRLKGIGPFYASLIVIRCLGFTDVLVDREPRLAALLGEHYDLGGPASPEQISEIAEAWRPWRTWAAVLVRAASGRQ
jgi:DNA-3-methyladenine glycosylase II